MSHRADGVPETLAASPGIGDDIAGIRTGAPNGPGVVVAIDMHMVCGSGPSFVVLVHVRQRLADELLHDGVRQFVGYVAGE